MLSGLPGVPVLAGLPLRPRTTLCGIPICMPINRWRIDMRLKASGELSVIEANPNPQLAHGEDFAESAQRAGVTYAKLIERIIGLGLQWQPSRMA